MGLAELVVDDLRCINHAEANFGPGYNLIWGPNGAGKTSLLEAAYLLGRGRSFRTRSSAKLIQHDKDRLIVFGRTDGNPVRSLGLAVGRAPGPEARIDGEVAASLADLSHVFAVQAVDASVHKLVEEGSSARRRWLDWGVFHVEPTFLLAWSKYRRALRQRNYALRNRIPEAPAWESELAHWGELLAAARSTFVSKLMPHWSSLVRRLVGVDVSLHHARGWSASISLGEGLREGRGRDFAQGTTHTGPHRGDVILRTNGALARDVLSRGQQKLVGFALALSQLRVVADATGQQPTLLLDDPRAELDPASLRRVADEVTTLGCQLVVTATSAKLDFLGTPERVFHVERGRVQQV